MGSGDLTKKENHVLTLIGILLPISWIGIPELGLRRRELDTVNALKVKVLKRNRQNSPRLALTSFLATSLYQTWLSATHECKLSEHTPDSQKSSQWIVNQVSWFSRCIHPTSKEFNQDKHIKFCLSNMKR